MQELSFDEMDEVAGGHPLFWIGGAIIGSGMSIAAWKGCLFKSEFSPTGGVSVQMDCKARPRNP